MTRSIRRRAALLAASAAVAAGLLSGCGAGQDTQTENQQPTTRGANAQSEDGLIRLRELSIAYRDPKGYPAGGNAPVKVYIANAGTTAVRLVGVTSNAGAVVLTGPGVAQASPSPATSAPSSPGASAPVSPRPGGSPGASPGGSPGGSPTASPSSASPSPSAPVGTSQINLEIPADGFALLTPERPRYLLLTRLAEPLHPVDTIELTFRFDNGVSITTRVSTEVPLSPPPRTPMDLHDEGEGGPAAGH